ncbi:MAG: DUF1775 domain-containing protein [Nitrococcus sp.]|nr:DUF1775 domain-containing protein [Nitrococcus sp.]
MRPIVCIFAVIIFTTVASGDALAHVTLAIQEAPAGSNYRAVLRVPHGCNGSATTAIRVQIPKGVIAVKPMPKPGWELRTKVGDYEKSYEYYGQTLTRGVKEIAWTGGNLPDAWYDEFVFRGRLPDAPAGTEVYFPVVQECVKGVQRWIAIPAPGKSAQDYDEPAPGLKLSEHPD